MADDSLPPELFRKQVTPLLARENLVQVLQEIEQPTKTIFLDKVYEVCEGLYLA